jgi:hypothetical protein
VAVLALEERDPAEWVAIGETALQAGMPGSYRAFEKADNQTVWSAPRRRTPPASLNTVGAAGRKEDSMSYVDGFVIPVLKKNPRPTPGWRSRARRCG